VKLGRLTGVLSICALVSVLSVSYAGAHDQRAAATCYAATALSTVSGHTGQAWGQVECSAQETYYWYNSLRNHAGTNLISADGYYINSSPPVRRR
jgi:hypothetical protein